MANCKKAGNGNGAEAPNTPKLTYPQSVAYNIITDMYLATLEAPFCVTRYRLGAEQLLEVLKECGDENSECPIE